MEGKIYEFGCLSDNAKFSWVYLLQPERDAAKTIRGSRSRCNLETGEIEYKIGQGFVIRKSDPIERISFSTGSRYDPDSKYTVRVQADSFREAKLKAATIYSKYLQDLATRVLTEN